MCSSTHTSLSVLRRYTLVLKGLEFVTTRHLRCKYLMVTHGILAHQYTLSERGLNVGSSFKGQVCLAGKDRGVDCLVGTQDLTGKVGGVLCTTRDPERTCHSFQY